MTDERVAELRRRAEVALWPPLDLRRMDSRGPSGGYWVDVDPGELIELLDAYSAGRPAGEQE